MSKVKKIGIVIGLIIVLAIAGIVTFIIIQNNKNKTAETVMTCKVNPQVQFLLNKNDKVMSVVALNDEGQEIIVKAEFEGKTAEEASKLFIELATEAGYIELSTAGTEVNVDFNGTKKDYAKLQESVVNSINSYFDEKGIIAGAVATISEDLKTAINNIKATGEDLSEKTNEELLAKYQEVSKEVEDISYTLRSTFYSALETLETTYESTKASIEDQIEDLKKSVDDAQKKLDNAEDFLKDSLQPALDLAKSNLENAEKSLKTATENFEKNYKELKEKYISLSEDAFNQLKDAINEKIENHKTALSEHQANFEENKDAIQAKINEYRNSLQQG